MKKTYLFILFIMWIVVTYTLPVFSGQVAEKTGELIIHIKGFDHSGGVAKVALVNSKENFSSEKPYKGFNFKIVNNIVRQTIAVPYGQYALKVYHDENENNKMDTHRMLGMPLEPYGFSNNAKGSFGPPDYKDTVFIIDSGRKEIIISLN